MNSSLIWWLGLMHLYSLFNCFHSSTNSSYPLMVPCLISVLPIFYWVFFLPFLNSSLLLYKPPFPPLDLLFFYFLLFSSRLFLSFFSLLLCSLRLLFNTKYYPTVMMQCSITCFALILIFLLSLRTRVSVILIQEAPEQGHRYIQHIDITINQRISVLDFCNVFIHRLFVFKLIDLSVCRNECGTFIFLICDSIILLQFLHFYSFLFQSKQLLFLIDFTSNFITFTSTPLRHYK